VMSFGLNGGEHGACREDKGSSPSVAVDKSVTAGGEVD